MKTVFLILGHVAAFLSVILGLLTLNPIAVGIGITTSACMIMLDGSQRRQEQLDSIEKELRSTRRELAALQETMNPGLPLRIREDSEEGIAAMTFLTDSPESEI